MIITIKKHYDVDDENFDGDDFGTEIFVGSSLVAKFSDGYHETATPAEAWLEGFRMGISLNEDHIDEVIHRKVADGKWIA